MLEQQVVLQIRNDKHWWWPGGRKHQRGQRKNATNFILVQLVQLHGTSRSALVCMPAHAWGFFEKDKAN